METDIINARVPRALRLWLDAQVQARRLHDKRYSLNRLIIDLLEQHALASGTYTPPSDPQEPA